MLETAKGTQYNIILRIYNNNNDNPIAIKKDEHYSTYQQY
jgi:hypothetical protein